MASKTSYDRLVQTAFESGWEPSASQPIIDADKRAQLASRGVTHKEYQVTHFERGMPPHDEHMHVHFDIKGNFYGGNAPQYWQRTGDAFEKLPGRIADVEERLRRPPLSEQQFGDQ